MRLTRVRLPKSADEQAAALRAASAFRRRMLGGLICLVGAWLLLRLEPAARRMAAMTGWGAFPSGVYAGWRARSAGADGTRLVHGELPGFRKSPKRRDGKKTRRPKPAKRPLLETPQHMRDALSDSGGGALTLPRRFDGLERARRKAQKPRATRKPRAPHGAKSAKAGLARAARSAPSVRTRTPAQGKPATGSTASRRPPQVGERKSAPRARPAPSERSVRVDFDGRTRRERSGARLAYHLPSSSISASPPFYRAAKAAPKPPKEKKAPTPKAPTLADWLGTGSLSPPKSEWMKKAPSFNPLKGAFPPSLPDGKAYDRRTPAPAFVETVAPPEEHERYERWLEIDDDKNRAKDDAHWHGDGKEILFMHFDKVWASPKDGRWVWLLREGTRWWTVADGTQRMVRDKERWWRHTEFGWFPLVEGQARAAAFAEDWKRAGLLKTGASIRFSADFLRVAVETPGLGSTVFDAQTGQYLDRLPQKR